MGTLDVRFWLPLSRSLFYRYTKRLPGLPVSGMMALEQPAIGVKVTLNES